MFPWGEHIILGICVSQVGQLKSVGICVSHVGEPITVGRYVSLGGGGDGDT